MKESKVQEDLNHAKKIEIDDKGQIKAMNKIVEKLENQLSEKDQDLKKLEREFKAQSDEKESELQVLKVKAQEDLDLAKKLEMEDKSEIKAKNEKVTRLESQLTEKEQHLKKLEVDKTKFEEDLKKIEIGDKSQIEAMKEKVDTLENQLTDKEQHLKKLEFNKSKVEEDLKKIEIYDTNRIKVMKEKVNTLENQLAEKDKYTKQIEEKYRTQVDDLELNINALISKLDKSNFFAKKSEMDDKKRIDALKKKLAGKDQYLKQMESGPKMSKKVTLFRDLFNAAKDQEIEKDKELKILKALHSKVQKDLNSAKETELNDKTQLKVIGEQIKKFKIENELIEKLKIEKDSLQQNVEEAHLTIAKNLEKIQHLEARNNCLEKDKASEKEFAQFLSKQNTLKEEKLEQDLSLKKEYMEIDDFTSHVATSRCGPREELGPISEQHTGTMTTVIKTERQESENDWVFKSTPSGIKLREEEDQTKEHACPFCSRCFPESSLQAHLDCCPAMPCLPS